VAQHLLELVEVAREGVGAQPLEGGFGQGRGLTPHVSEKRACDLRQLTPTLAERRETQPPSRQTREEVLVKQAVRDQGSKVPVGARDQPPPAPPAGVGRQEPDEDVLDPTSQAVDVAKVERCSSAFLPPPTDPERPQALLGELEGAPLLVGPG